LRAQRRGDLGEELRAFLAEVLQDIRQFPMDVGLDSRHPERRIDRA
jgi:hypothetical protein